MRSINRAVSRSALAIATAAAALIASTSTATAADFQPEFWDKNCHYGRACLFSGGNGVYNADRCFDNFDVNFYFDRALAHANAFTVYYKNGKSDYVPANTLRYIDAYTMVTKVVVWC